MPKTTLYFDNQCGIESYAVAVDGKLTECAFEKESSNLVGNVYKGRVVNLLNGMQAAFVNCGLSRNCYVSVQDLLEDRTKYDGTDIDIPSTLNLHVGDEIIVQITKPPIGKKGAKATTQLSFVGKYCIYMPTTPFIGVSRKISDEAVRQRLMDRAATFLREGEGLVVRTESARAARQDRIDELNFFRGVYRKILNRFETAKVGDILHGASPLFIRALRDNDLLGVDEVCVGNKALSEIVTSTIRLSPRHPDMPIKNFSGKDMFFDVGLHDQLLQMMQPRVDLENGAYLIIEATEALTTIDVNTGKFIGEDSLEDTVYFTNVLAAKEIARQVRLRNIGGIVVVDFIDMESTTHQKSIVEELTRALASDKSKCNVMPMSKLGLVEFTRKRQGNPPVNIMTRSCRYCHGAGDTRTYEFILFDLRAKLLDILSQENKVVTIDMNREVANRLLEWQQMIDSIKADYPSARVYIVPHNSYNDDTITFRVDNSPTITLPPSAILLY
jgi:ribonuclease G